VLQIKNRLDSEALFGDTTSPRLQSLGLKGLNVTAKSMEKLLNRHRKSLRGLSLEVRYLTSSEEAGSARIFTESATTTADEQKLFARFLSELAKSLVGGMELVSDIYLGISDDGIHVTFIWGNIFGASG
jgi:hypothetical protein